MKSTRTWRRATRFLALLLLAAPGCRRPPAPDELPVLMYHNIAEHPGNDVWSVATEEFRRQLEDLKLAGHATILPHELPRGPRGGKLPAKPLVITFDDGLLSVMTEAEPLLRAAGFRAICYLITDYIADHPAQRRDYRGEPCLTWEEIRAMARRGVIAFGIHSATHAQNPRLQAVEVERARAILRAKTGLDSTDYCYPYGNAPAMLRDAVAAAGYRTALICGDRLFRPAADTDLLRIPRVSVYGGKHDFGVTPGASLEQGSFSATVSNRGVALPVRGLLRENGTGRSWHHDPGRRLDATPRQWRWTNLPPDVAAERLRVEIWEQNELFRYHP